MRLHYELDASLLDAFSTSISSAGTLRQTELIPPAREESLTSLEDGKKEKKIRMRGHGGGFAVKIFSSCQ